MISQLAIKIKVPAAIAEKIAATIGEIEDMIHPAPTPIGPAEQKTIIRG